MKGSRGPMTELTTVALGSKSALECSTGIREKGSLGKVLVSCEVPDKQDQKLTRQTLH